MRALWLAEGGEKFVPPGAGDFDLPPIFLGITKPMLLVVLSVVIISVYFLMASRRLKIVPSRFTFVAESIYDFGRNNIARDSIGSKDFMPYVPLIVAMFTFVLVNNLFGIIPIIQFPTLAHIGFPMALSVLIIYPLWNYIGIRKHGFFGHFKHQLVPPGVPKPVLDKISNDWADALKNPEMDARIKGQFLIGVSDTPAAMDKIVKDETATMTETFKAAGIGQ